jgi:hypothetical protein
MPNSPSRNEDAVDPKLGGVKRLCCNTENQPKHIRTAPDFVAGGKDPWAGHWRTRQTLDIAAALLTEAKAWL